MTTPITQGPVDVNVMHHTPGPWEVAGADNYEIRSRLMPAEFPHRFKSDSTGNAVAYVGNHTPDFGEANANLIAAAPDLLVAAIAVIEILDTFDADVIHALRDAVAKALGHNGEQK